MFIGGFKVVIVGGFIFTDVSLLVIREYGCGGLVLGWLSFVGVRGVW